jgi:hypothetical protein
VYKIIIILCVFFIPGIATQAQNKPDPKETDKTTLALFKAGKWDELADVCENAIDDGLDFYLLRFRAGVAYYKKEDYLSAARHFEKAINFNPMDLISMEYLYYSYVFTGRESEELALIYEMPLKLKKKLQVYSKFIYGAYAEGGYTFNQEFSDQTQRGFMSMPNFYNEQRIQNSITYLDIGLMHQLDRNVKVFQSYNNISTAYTHQFLEQFSGPKNFDTKSTQDEYYLNINFNLGKAWNLATAFHYMYVKSENVELKYDSSVYPWIANYNLVKSPENDFVVLLSLTKLTGHFRLGLKNSVSNMNSATQFQNTAEIIFYPLGNLNFNTISNATLFLNRAWGEKIKSSGIFDQSAGIKISGNLWMEAGYTFGYIYNYNENDGFIVFNNPEKISERIKANFIIPLSRHIQLSLRYENYKQEFSTLYYTTIRNDNTNITKTINHKIIGSFKWIF